MKLKLTESKIHKINIEKSDVVYAGVFDSDELNPIPNHILEFEDWYWTADDCVQDKSCIKLPNLNATAVNPNGEIFKLLPDELCEVRPFIDVKNTKDILSLKKGDIVNCFGLNWYCVERYDLIITLFCMDSIGECEFSVPGFGYSYVSSKLNDFVQNWWKSVKDDPDLNKHFEAKIYSGKNLIDTLYSDDLQEVSNYVDDWLLNEDPNTSNMYAEILSKLSGKTVTIRPSDLLK